MKEFILTIFAFLCCGSVFANVRLPKIFGDKMVLQRDHAIPVWGWADSREKITVLFNKQSKTVVTDKAGKWRIDLSPEAAGGPFEMVIKGKNTITFTDVLVGDVWVCSGQSNMEWTLKNTNDAEVEIKKASYPQIRHFEVPKSVAASPKDDLPGGDWQPCTPGTAGNFTAVGYYFAKELQLVLNVPVGLINTSWGGTHVETWTSRNAFENSDEFKTMIAGMPVLNLDSLSKQKNASTTKRIEGLQGSLQNISATLAGWKDIEVNDGSWPKINVPGTWEEQALGDMDGVVWYRKTFIIPAAGAGKEAVLELAMIDDADDCYLNGVKVGSTNAYNEKRKYNIAPGILKEGKNVIAVRVLDTGGGGGIFGEADNVKITVGGNAVSLAGEWLFKVESLLASSVGVGPNSYPTLLSNAMLSPLIPFAIKGAIWYQGESNAGRAYQYRQAFPLMITDWRKRWGQGDFPFYFVQLATFNSDNGNSTKGSTWAELREAQTLSLSLPNTGMAVTTDIGDPKDIHPRNKLDVGRRLAAVALNKTYGKANIYSGPSYESLKVEGNKIILSFTNIGSGLSAKNKYGYLQGFEIAGGDQQFHYAKAFIEGDKVIVYQEGVSNPVAVRFGWADNAEENNLFNKDGFPAVPFRTDNWKSITAGNKYQIGN